MCLYKCWIHPYFFSLDMPECDEHITFHETCVTSETFPSIFNLFESITANRPRAAHLAKGSTKSGAVGSNSTSAFSNCESSGGFSTLAPPVFFPIFHKILVILQATLAVREKTTGQYPGLRTPGCSCTAT